MMMSVKKKKPKEKADPATVSFLVLLMRQLYSQKEELMKIMVMTMEKKKRLLVLHLWRRSSLKMFLRLSLLTLG